MAPAAGVAAATEHPHHTFAKGSNDSRFEVPRIGWIDEEDGRRQGVRERSTGRSRMLGAGIALLFGERLSRQDRHSLGMLLFAVDLITTVPFAYDLLIRRSVLGRK
jgi:hypothetical protein